MKAMDFPSGAHPAGMRRPPVPHGSAFGSAAWGTSSREDPPSAETTSRPRGEPNMMRPPSGDQDGQRWGRSLPAATAMGLPPSSRRTRISSDGMSPAV
jgi:hypothetical protein